MASNLSSFLSSASEHTVVDLSKMLTTEGGKHIVNLELTEDADNGTIWKIGEWQDLDYYAPSDDTPTFEGVIRYQDASGYWQIEVLSTDDDTVILAQDPVIYENYTTKLSEASQFFNEAGDIVKAPTLAYRDFFGVTDAGFESGTPAAGSTVTVDSSTHKLVVASSTESE